MNELASQQIYQVWPDHEKFADQWYLHAPRTASDEEIDAREFTQGRTYEGPRPAIVPIANPRREVAFHLGSFLMPVVSTAVAETIFRIAPGDVEFFPVEVPASKRLYLILNVICALACLDEKRSEFTRWQEADGRADRLGKYRMISTIRVDPARTEGHHIFRIKDWPLALLVSDTLKSALETIPDLGIVFDPAS